MSNKYEMTGTIRHIGETQSFGEKGFTKREFLVEEIDGKYPQTLKMEAVRDGCACLDAYRVGDPVTVSFNLRGSEYKGKHYVSLQAWKFDRESKQQVNAPRQQSAHNESKSNGYAPQTQDSLDCPF